MQAIRGRPIRLILVVIVLGAVAFSARYWAGPLLGLITDKKDTLDAVSTAIQFVLWTGAAVVFIAGMLRPAKSPPPAPPPPAPTAVSPKITDLPRVPPRNPDFTGREEGLKALRASLLKGGTAALTQAITGLGGVGKTQLATEYAYRYRDGYDHILWVRSEEPAQLADDFAGLAKLLDLPEQDEQDQRLLHQAVCQWLARNGRWLLIFDNVPHPDSLKGYRPEEGHGHVIITSRDPDWAGVATPLKVEVWEPDESLEFLDKRLGRADQAAAELAAELGHLPLALAQAAAYIRNSGMSLDDYLKLYRERREELWGKQPPPHDYTHTVTTTWAMAMDKLQEEEPAAADLLNLLAFLAPDDIPRDLLAKVIDDPLVLNRAITALGNYSLITTDDDSISIHRLVQAVTRDRLSEEERKEWAGVAVRLLHAAFPFDQYDPTTWQESGRLLPHALAAAEHAADAGVELNAAGRTLNNAGVYLRVRAAFAAARTVYERVVSIAESAFGPKDPRVATAVNNLGNVLQDLGELKRAKAHFERAMAIDEKAYGPDHPAVARDVNNLGGVLQDLGDLKGAKAHFERALTIDEKAYGPDHPKVAIRVNNLGGVLQDLGDLEAAKEHYERALKIDEKVYGPDHPEVATDANNLGYVLGDMGDLDGAKAHYERALAIDEKAYGPDHPDVARDVNNLGTVFFGEGNYEEARRCQQRALDIDEKIYGPDHPTVANRVSNLGDIFAVTGDTGKAREYYERALAIFVKFLGEEHPSTQRVRGNLEALGKK